MELAARRFGLSPEMMLVEPHILTAKSGRFDIVLAAAFFEQLFNPILALSSMAAIASRVLLLETAQAALDETRPVMTATLLAMPYNATVPGWAPNPPLMLHLLRQLGFDRILYREHPTEGRARGFYAALKPEAPRAMLDGFAAPWSQLAERIS